MGTSADELGYQRGQASGWIGDDARKRLLDKLGSDGSAEFISGFERAKREQQASRVADEKKRVAS